jgi:hypothetical protein
MAAASGKRVAKALKPAAWVLEAPFSFPSPIASIFTRPLSTGARNSVCGFTRFTTTTPSQAKAALGVAPQPAKLFNVHGGVYGRPGAFFVHAQLFEHLFLPRRRGPPVGAHGWYDNRLGAHRAQVTDGGGDHLGNAVNAPAPYCHPNPAVWPEARRL